MAQCLHRPNATLMVKRHRSGRHVPEATVDTISNTIASKQEISLKWYEIKPYFHISALLKAQKCKE